MDNRQIVILILGLAFVCFIPRAIPALFADKMQNLGPKAEKFLRLIPYTAMAALIFPGVLSVDASKPAVGIAGAAVAGLLAWLKCSMMVCVTAAISVVFVIYLFI